MKIRDMYRTDWTRITKRDYISRPFLRNGRRGREALLLIRDITAPLTVCSAGKPVKIVERGYSWLQIAIEGETHWLTAMFDENGTLLQVYFDITAGNCFGQPDNPTFRDMYLDIVLSPEGKTELLDEEELTEALMQKKITKEEHDRALKDSDALQQYLLAHWTEVIERCRHAYRELRAMFPD